jgi:hypothetical protein
MFAVAMGTDERPKTECRMPTMRKSDAAVEAAACPVLKPVSPGSNRHSSEGWNLFAFQQRPKRKVRFQLSLE